MEKTSTKTASDIRASLNHPVVDADGHWLEYTPLMNEQMRRIGGEKAAKGFQQQRALVHDLLAMSVAQRRDERLAQQAFWAVPAKNVRDRATAMLPRLMYERLDELGIDFSVLYPTAGLKLHNLPDAKIRQATCRAYNTFTAEYFQNFSDRLTPAAIIPMYTPDEAIEEIDYVTDQLDLKVIMMGSLMRRPIASLDSKPPSSTLHNHWLDVVGLDSEYDYDPVWQRCTELGLSPTFHTHGCDFGLRLSPSNFVYNHVGHFAAANEAVCKALFLGGVTRRFPKLKFAFLEGGVGWACQLLGDLVEHWEKRNFRALELVKPSNLDMDALIELADEYGGEQLARALRKGRGTPASENWSGTGGITDLDDFSACQIVDKTEVRDLFAPNFYFGCEADDRMTALAFNRQQNSLGARLNTLFGSDVGHFDVTDMTQVLPEAYELVDDGLITEEDFRDFMFTNPVRFWGEQNPDFFKGTIIEKEAAQALAQSNDSPDDERGR